MNEFFLIFFNFIVFFFLFYLQFSCNPSYVAKVTQQLTALNYKILTADEDFIPRSPVNLSDEDLKKVEFLCSKLSAFEEVVTIHHNIIIPDAENE